MGQYSDLSYDTMIHDVKTGRLATLAEVVARHSREQQISLEDADAYVKELLEIPSSRFHVESEQLDDDDDLAYGMQRMKHAQVAAQTLIAATTLLQHVGGVDIAPDRIKRLIHSAFGTLEAFYSDANSGT